MKIQTEAEKLGLDGDPCICGCLDTWHPGCYAGQSQAQIDAAHKYIMAALRNLRKRQVKQMVEMCIEVASHKRCPTE